MSSETPSRVERAQEARMRLDDAAIRALDVLVAVCEDEAAPAAVRVRAAQVLLHKASWATGEPQIEPFRPEPASDISVKEATARLRAMRSRGWQ